MPPQEPAQPPLGQPEPLEPSQTPNSFATNEQPFAQPAPLQQPAEQMPQQPTSPAQQPAPSGASVNPMLPMEPANNSQELPHEPDQGKHHLSSVGKRFFNLIEFDPDEQLLLEIRKHPFGLFIIVVTGSLIALSVFVITLLLASSNVLDAVGLGETGNSLAAFVGFILALVVILVTGINAHLYRNNVVYVTSEKIAQILYITLFNRKISQLNIGDVQDVTVSQDGFLPNIVGYGTLVIETAGEQQNYTFTFVPKPYETSKTIIGAHEANIKYYGN